MGSIFSFTNKQPVKILMAGLDAAGKTTILYQMKEKDLETVPTIGLTIDKARINNLEIYSWDSGGRTKMGRIKMHFNTDTVGVIYVIDMNDRERFEEAIDELKKELSYVENEFRKEALYVPLLILANKQDLPAAMSSAELMKNSDFVQLTRHRAWHIQECCATTRDGLLEGLEWFSKQLEKPNNGGLRAVTAGCDLK